MARFYQTAQRNFVDDFIFQPNMELAAMALQKKDGDIKDQLDTLELMKNLPIDYWKEADQNNVNQIQQEYESRVDDITKQMQGDLMNTGNNRYLINQLRKDVEKDYSSGRIRQIQDNALAYKQYKTKLEALPNPVDREGYGRATSQYIQTTPGGALTSIFKAPEIFSTEQYGNDFVKSENFKQLEADSGGSIYQSPKGEWLVKTGNTVKKLGQNKIEEAFKGFIQSNPNVMGRAIAGGKLFGENNWLDENGELSFKPGSYLGDQMIPIAKSLAYKNTTSEKTMGINPVWQQQEEERQQIRKESREAYRAAQLAKSEIMPPETSKVATFAANTASNTVDIVNDKLSKLGQKYGIKLNTNNLDELITWSEKNKKGTFGAEIKKLKTTLNEGLRASYEPLYHMGFDQKYVTAFKNNLQEGMITKGDNVKGYADFKGANMGSTGDMTKRVSPNEMVGKTIGGRKILRASIVDKSSFPVFFGTSDLVNQIQSTLEIEFEPKKGKDGKPDESGESNFKYLDYYQPSIEITGSNRIKEDIINANVE